MTDSECEVSPEVARLVADAADAFQARRARGEEPDPEEYAARHPAAADAIRGVLGVLRHAPVAPSVAPEPRVLGDFRIIRQVGRGGMGIVYEAAQISLGRRVALKVLPFAALVDEHLLQRFHTEARAAAGLDHPHVVQVHAVGEERGTHFIAMQFIDGRPLSDLIRDWHGGGPRFVPAAASAPTETYRPNRPAGDGSARTAEAANQSTLAEARSPAFFRRAAGLAGQAAGALAHAHAAGVVHRDVKPGNLLVDGTGHLWVSDFGLAKMTASDAGLTRTGDVFGTLRYLSPEQAHGQNDRVDGRADVYALGATLYEMLTGYPVVSGSDRLQILWQVIHHLPVPPRAWNRAVPADLEAVCLKCLEKDPNRRYQTAGALAEDLDRWLDGRPTIARPLGVWGRTVRGARRRRTSVLVGALLVGCLGSVATAAYLLARAPGQTVGEGNLDPKANLRRIETALVRGEPVELIGRTGMPIWHELINGRADTAEVLDAADCYRVRSSGFTLVELAKDPGTDQFTFSASVRHDRGEAYARVGLYVGRVTYPRAPRDLQFVVELTFNSVTTVAEAAIPGSSKKSAGRTSPVDLSLHLLAEEAGPPNVYVNARAAVAAEVAALGIDNGRWFDLSLTVTPAGVSATFDGHRVELPRGQLDALLETALEKLRRRHPDDAAIRAVRPTFTPRGGIGVEVRHGAAAFRNATLVPLANPR